MRATAELSEAKRSLLAKYRFGSVAFPSERIPRKRDGTLAPLTLSQEELWRREQQVPGIAPLYNECVTVNMNGALDLSAMECALTEIVNRHEIWRTTFETRAGAPVQVVQSPSPVRIPVLDLRGIPDDIRDREAILRMNAEAARPFRLEQEAPLRPMLARMAEREHRLYLIAHQIVLDGRSAYQIFPSELAELYIGFATGSSPKLPVLPIQCSDFALWQRETQSFSMQSQLEYWREEIGDDHSAPHWPTVMRQKATRTYRGVIRSFAFSTETSERIRRISQQEKVTLFSTLVAGVAALLFSHCQQEKVMLGTLSPSGRKRNDVLGLLGYFLNPVTLKFDFSSEPTFVELIHQVKRVVAEAICNDDVPIELLARQLKPGDSSPGPFFRVAVSLQPPTPALGLDWTVTSMNVQSGGSPWELYLAFIDQPGGIIGRVQFDPDLLAEDVVQSIVRDLERLLQTYTGTPLYLTRPKGN
jgi:hypothetical protein